MLESRSLNEWDSWLQRRELKQIDWDNPEAAVFIQCAIDLLRKTLDP